MKLYLAYPFVVSIVFFAVSVQGGIKGHNQLLIDFTKQKDATAKATWSSPEKIAITAQGLGFDAQAAQSIRSWIQTKPLAVGLSWRTASSVSLRVTIKPTPKPILLNSGQTHTPYIGRVYARFSPDATHWSTWQALNPTYPIPKESTERLFSGRLSVPQRERTEYSKLIKAYSKLDVPWVSDEEAAVKWILARDAKFFERSLPFIGYVEFLFEARLYGGQRITALKADVDYGMSGLHQTAKDPNAAKDRNMPWRFKAK